MDVFNDNFDQTEVDPAAEFLAREQDDLAGLEDELKPAMSVPPVAMGNYHLSDTYKFISSLCYACYELNQCFNF